MKKFKKTGKTERSKRKNRKVTYWSTFKEIWKYSLVVMLNFFFLLATYPSFAVLIKSTKNIPEDWFPIIILTIFNVSDFFAKIVASIEICLNSHDFFLWFALVLKIVACPILIIFSRMEINDFITYFIITMIGLSNGFISSVKFSFCLICFLI